MSGRRGAGARAEPELLEHCEQQRITRVLRVGMLRPPRRIRLRNHNIVNRTQSVLYLAVFSRIGDRMLPPTKNQSAVSVPLLQHVV